jgi:hypothetical protein
MRGDDVLHEVIQLGYTPRARINTVVAERWWCCEDKALWRRPRHPVPHLCTYSFRRRPRARWVVCPQEEIRACRQGPKRQTLERRLAKLESEAAQLREQLANLPTEEDFVSGAGS